MTRYILDTNILIDLEYPDTPAYQTIMDRLSSLPEDSEVCFSIITAYEYQHGIAKAPLKLFSQIPGKSFAFFAPIWATPANI
jgi:predicted nucleic acid-binding protein